MISRRRTIALMAAAAGAVFTTGRAEETFRWAGFALGADASIVLSGLPRPVAERAVLAARQEIDRLESIFSLYRPDSELARLNRDKRLDRPSQDLRLLLSRAISGWEATDGAFNPAIHPLWQYLARHFAGEPDREPDGDSIKRLLAICDPARIAMNAGRIELAPEMSLTLNGIAQGHVTDAAARLLEAEGLSNILLDLGEVYALPGRTWEVAVRRETDSLSLCHRAVAQSAGEATRFTADGRWHHLLDPNSGRSASRFKTATVLASNATDADLLSTALYVASPERHSRILSSFPDAQAILRS